MIQVTKDCRPISEFRVRRLLLPLVINNQLSNGQTYLFAMFFSSALSALQKHQEEEDDEEEDVFQHGKWPTALSYSIHDLRDMSNYLGFISTL